MMLAITFSGVAFDKDFVREKEPYPVVTNDSWVLFEIWPKIPNFHVEAYFTASLFCSCLERAMTRLSVPQLCLG